MMAATLDEVGDLLEAVDPRAAYWISEKYENPVHIKEVMNIELRRIAAETGRCFGREHYTHGQLGFWETIPWYYTYLRRHGFNASAAYWIAKQPFIECKESKQMIGLPYAEVLLSISWPCPGAVLTREEKTELRRKGLSTQAIKDQERANRLIIAKTEKHCAIMVLPEVDDPYLANATIQRMVAKAALGCPLGEETP